MLQSAEGEIKMSSILENLINKNKEELVKDQQFIFAIERKIEEKIINRSYPAKPGNTHITSYRR